MYDSEAAIFDAKKITNELILWIRNRFTKNGSTSPAVIGILGGKDSSVVAALCVRALGRDRVIGMRGQCHEGKNRQITQTKFI